MLGFTASTNAFIRHVYSFLGGMAAIAGIAGISPDTFQQIVTSMHQIGDGVSSILAGLGPLLTLASGAYAAWKSTHANQISAVKAIPGMTVSGTPTPAPNSVTAAVRSHWAPLALGLALIAPMLGGCFATVNGVQVVVTPQNFAQVVTADVVATCEALTPLANAVTIVAPAVADVIGQDSAGASVAAVSTKSSAACNKVTGQLATGTTTVAPVPITPAATVTTPGG